MSILLTFSWRLPTYANFCPVIFSTELMSYTIRVFEDCDVCCFTEVRFCCSLRFWRKSGTKLKFDEVIWEMIMHVVSRFFWYTCLRLQNLFNHLVLTKILLWMKTKYF